MGWAGSTAWMWMLMLAGTTGLWLLVALLVRALLGPQRPQQTSTDAQPLLHERPARRDVTPEDLERRRLLTDSHTTPAAKDLPPADRAR